MRLRATRLSAIAQGTRSSGGSAPAWTPAQITTAVWLDAADTSTITLNGSTVSQWSDKSGNGRNVAQATAANQPTYATTGLNGKPVLTFDGVDDFVGSGIAAQTGFFITVLAPGARDYGGALGFNAKHGILREGTTNVLYFSTANMFPSTSARRNGALSTVLGAANSAAIFSQGGTESSRTLVLGRDVAGGNPDNCNIAEVVLLSIDPSTDTRQRLEGYLAWKWGLQADLPVDHPYKNTPPTV